MVVLKPAAIAGSGMKLLTEQVRTRLYDALGVDREVEFSQVSVADLNADQLLWISGSLADVQALPDLPADISRAVAAAAHCGGVEVEPAFYEFTVPLGNAGQMIVAVGSTWLLTLAPTEPEFAIRFAAADRPQSVTGKLTPSSVAASLLAAHLDDFRDDLASIEKAIDELDETILRSRERRAPLKVLAVLRRRISNVRHAMHALHPTVHGLSRPDVFAQVDPSDQGHFLHLVRTFDRLEDAVARTRETVVGSFELYTTRVAQDTNQLITVLTVATVITGVVGAVAGIFGMNFDTPFVHWGFAGWLSVVAAMLGLSGAILGLAFWRRWI